MFFIWVFFTLGIVLTYAFKPQTSALIFLFALSAAALYIFISVPRISASLWCGVFLSLVALAGALRLSAQKNFSCGSELKGVMRFAGYVSGYRRKMPLVSLRQIISGTEHISFEEQALINNRGSGLEFRIGDYITFTGNIVPSKNIYFNGFHYGKILTFDNISHSIYLKDIESIKSTNKFMIARAMRKIRSGLSGILSRHIPYPHSAQAKALILGVRDDIPKQIISDYRNTGTAHILAISGMHVALIAYILHIIFSALRLRLFWNRILSAALIILYCVLTGMSSSVVRASAIIVIYLLGFVIKRESGLMNSLGSAGMLILLVNPLETFKTGYILSFASVLSITTLYENLRILTAHIISRGGGFTKKIAAYIIDSISMSVAAWAGVIPVIAYFFGLWTPGAIFANLYTIPLTFLAIASGICVIAFNFLHKGLAGLFGHSTAFFLYLSNSLNGYFAGFKGMYFEVKSFSAKHIVFYYAVYLAAAIALAMAAKRRQKKSGLPRRKQA